MKDYIERFRQTFESEYTWREGFMRNVYRYGSKRAMYFPETKEVGHIRSLTVR